jgi:hypothetical protein
MKAGRGGVHSYIGSTNRRISVQTTRAWMQNSMSKITNASQEPWLTPVIPATQEAAIRRIKVQSQPRK